MMDCDTFKLNIDAAPDENFDGRAAHERDCAQCAAYLGRAETFEKLLARAMNIPVPELPGIDLPESGAGIVDLAKARSAREAAGVAGRPGGLRTPLWAGIAATLALALYAGLRFAGPGPADSELLASQILGHMRHEPQALTVTSTAVPGDAVNAVLQPASAQMSPDIGLISYARSCEINGRSVPHFVVQGENGPVTLILMSSEAVGAAVSLDNEEFQGVILPSGDGSVAIIGRKGESFDDVRNKVDEAVLLSI